MGKPKCMPAPGLNRARIERGTRLFIQILEYYWNIQVSYLGIFATARLSLPPLMPDCFALVVSRSG